MFKSLTLLLALMGLGCAQQNNWANLKTTWGPVPGFRGALASQPRTASELDNEGWVQLTSCDNPDPKFPGDRFAPSADEKDIVLIFDGQGFIAGVQHVIPFDKADQEIYDFEGSPFYEDSDYFGEQVWYTTAYFVDPKIICEGGRSVEEFEAKGTGSELHFQNGPSIKSLLSVPLTIQDARESDIWREQKCFTNMGIHFMQLEDDPNADCRKLAPLQLIYNQGHLNAFVMNHLANLDGRRWEKPAGDDLRLFVHVLPTCLKDNADQGLFSAMHIFVKEYLVSCGDQY